jgi:hypothetical protein
MAWLMASGLVSFSYSHNGKTSIETVAKTTKIVAYKLK